MDESVLQAMAKWPRVPHCYGWLLLDARGNWRMRDERAQALDLPGEKLAHPALLAFINRNYAADAHGCWYFQNGPQRVYVQLAATPYIARTDPELDFVLHTGEHCTILAVWATEIGQLLFQHTTGIALLDDRDLLACIERLEIDDTTASETALSAWLEDRASASKLYFRYRNVSLPVQYVMQSEMAKQFGFVCTPQPPQP